MKDIVKPFVIVFSLFLIFFILLKGLGEALGPLLFSFTLAYLLFPLIEKLEKKGIQRNISVISLFVSFLSLFVITLFFVIPVLFQDIQSFLKEFPQNASVALEKMEFASETLGFPIEFSHEKMSTFLQEHLREVSNGLLKSVTKGLKSSFSGLTQWILAILNLFLIPLFFFYVINDYEKISKEIISFIPPPLLKKLKHYFQLSNRVLSGYIRGQLMVVLVLSALYGMGLMIIGLKFGFIIGLLSGILSLIPYAGFTIGFIAALVMSFAHFTGWRQVFGVVAVFIIIQLLEGTLITPKLVGNKVGLSAFVTMLALIIGGNLLGLLGMLIAIPLAAILKTLIFELKNQYKNLDIFKEI